MSEYKSLRSYNESKMNTIEDGYSLVLKLSFPIRSSPDTEEYFIKKPFTNFINN